MDANNVQKIEIRLRELTKRHDDNEHRISELEKRWYTFEAVNVERRERTEAEFKRVHERLDKIDGNLSKVVWLVVAALVGGFFSFLFKGGFGGAI